MNHLYRIQGEEEMALYDRIGQGYDATRRADPAIVTRLIHHLQPKPDGHYLDLACGTANYTARLAAQGVHMTGVDASQQMLREAALKAPQLKLLHGVAENLPFAARSFDGAICTLAIHHFTDLAAAFREVRRVLSGGRFVIFTTTPEQTQGYWLNHYFPQALKWAIDVMPSLEAVRGALEQSGFRFLEYEIWHIPENPVDLFLYAGKYQPELYFDPRIRAGISTFAAGGNTAEVETGLTKLSEDLASGQFTRIAASYSNTGGDYGFVICEAA